MHRTRRWQATRTQRWQVVLMLGALLAGSAAQAADPHESWFTVSTEHFRVHFHVSDQDPPSHRDAAERFARRVGSIAEESLDVLSEALGWMPANDVVHVVCTDNVDGANGLARTQPYDFITIFAFGPEADTDLGRYDDWLRVLVYHEITHILHLDVASGLVVDVVNSVLGKSLQPNQALPTWFTEGIATWVETRFTGSGRVGSVQFQQYLRVAALEGTLPKTLGGFTGAPIADPGGGWPYAFGGTFLTWVVEQYGQQRLVDFVNRYGRRFIPFGINNVARATFGVDFVTLYERWRTEFVQHVRAVVAAERKRGLREGRRLTGLGLERGGSTNHAVSFAPDGRLTWVHSTGYASGNRMVGRLTEKGLEAEPLYQCYGGCGRAMWSPRGDVIYSIGGRWKDPYRFWRHVLRYDLRTNNRRHGGLPNKVTHGVRAREPDLSPDGRRIVFVTSRWGENALMELDLVSGEYRQLVTFETGLDLAHPRYLKLGKGAESEGAESEEAIVFSAQRSGQFRDLWLRRASGALERLTHDKHREITPTIGPDGIIYFVSDRSGIWNVHALDRETGRQWQVTRVLGAALNPAVSPDGKTLVYSGYHAWGFDLWALPIDRSQWTLLPSEDQVEPPPYDPAPAEATVAEYSAWKSVWPHRWVPSFQYDSASGNAVIGLGLSGNDAVGHHFWSLNATLDQEAQDVSLGLSYGYGGVRPYFSMFFARFPGAGFNFVADDFEVFHKENLYASFDVSVGIPELVYPMYFSTGLTWWYAFDPDPPTRLEHDPGSYVPYVDSDTQRVGVRFSWGFDRVESFRYSISPERGWRAGTSFNLFPTFLGNPGTGWTLSWYVDAYASLGKAHALAFKYSAATSGGDDPSRFAIGGFPRQDLLTDLINQGGIYGNYLRGYAPSAFEGQNYHLFTAEYRLPIWDIFWAPGTLPAWFKRLQGAVFSDMVLIYDDEVTADSYKATIGAELQLGMNLFYNVPISFKLGYAHALTTPASNGVYFILGSSL